MDDLNALCYEYDGTLYITFEVAKMKSPDQFGREYTVYVNRKEDSPDESKDEKNPPKPKTTGKRRNVRESIKEAPELIAQKNPVFQVFFMFVPHPAIP